MDLFAIRMGVTLQLSSSAQQAAASTFLSGFLAQAGIPMSPWRYFSQNMPPACTLCGKGLLQCHLRPIFKRVLGFPKGRSQLMFVIVRVSPSIVALTVPKALIPTVPSEITVPLKLPAVTYSTLLRPTNIGMWTSHTSISPAPSTPFAAC